MRLITWNVNGLRSAVKGGIEQWVRKWDPDILMFQETRCNSQVFSEVFPQYEWIHSPFENIGRAGVAILSKFEIKGQRTLRKGRLLACQIEGMTMYSTYLPHGYNETFDEKLDLLQSIFVDVQSRQKVIVAGDFNIAIEDIDTHHNPCRMIGCKDEERHSMNKLGMRDLFREMNPSSVAYTFWDKRLRNENRGWRLDYILASDDIRIADAKIPEKSDALFKVSDHLPVIADLMP